MEKTEYIEHVTSLLLTIVKSLVDIQEEVTVTSVVGEQTVQFIIDCNKTDIGKVIGKKGNNIQSIRQILFGVACKNHFRSVISLKNE